MTEDKEDGRSREGTLVSEYGNELSEIIELILHNILLLVSTA